MLTPAARNAALPLVATLLALAPLSHAAAPASPAPAARAAPDSTAHRAPASPLDERTRALAQLSEPGPQHQRLRALAGHWNTLHRITPAPGADPIEVPGTAEIRSVLGGRFVTVSGQVEYGGEKGYSMGVYGYDRFKNRYTFWFIQDHDTQSISGLGSLDATGETILFDVTMDLPQTGETAKHYRTLLTFDGPDRCTFEMWTAATDGKEWRPLQIVYTRD